MNSNVITVTLNPALDKTIVIDRLKVGELNRAGNVRMDSGGKGINVARVLHKFGINVVAAGLIAGFQGKLLLKYLEEQNIRTIFKEVPGETRINLKIIEETTKGMTEINEAGFTVDDQIIKEFKDILSGLLDRSELLVLSGSLPQGVRNDIYKDFIYLAKSKGVKTILDADGDVLREGIKASPYAIKPNVYEFERLFGQKMKDDFDIIQAAGHLLKSGIKLVIVSKGSDGAVILNESESCSVKTFPIVPKSAVGAGDSMVAALAYALMNDMNIKEICRWVTAAGTLTASKEGTLVCEPDEILTVLDRVEVKRII